MRTSLLNLDQPIGKAPAPLDRTPIDVTAANSAPVYVAASAPAPAVESSRTIQEEPDFEIVLGRGQVASTGLVLAVALVCVSGISYLIGKTAGAKAPTPAAAASAPTPADVPSPAPGPAQPAAKSSPTAAAPVKNADASRSQAPLFTEAVSGKVYIQVGAIEKSLAGIWAEGLRTHGLDAFVSSGPGDNTWRVLIGPLPDPQSYQHAKSTLDQLGVNTFGRRFGDAPAPQQSQPQAQQQQPPQQRQPEQH